MEKDRIFSPKWRRRKKKFEINLNFLSVYPRFESRTKESRSKKYTINMPINFQYTWQKFYRALGDVGEI